MFSYRPWITESILILVMVALFCVVGKLEQLPADIKDKVELAGGY